MRSAMIVGFTVLLLGLPASAQQPSPQAPSPPDTTNARGPGARPMGGPGGQGMMMGGQGPGMSHSAMRRDDDEDDDHAGPMRGWHHHHGRDGAPMQVIINIGPDNRVEVEDREARGMGADRTGGPMMMEGEWGQRSIADRAEARLNDLRRALQLTAEQQPAWERFANAVRDAVTHMRPSLEAMQAENLEQRLTAYETMLSGRLDATRTVHTALTSLTGSLNETQRHTLDEYAARLMPRMGRMQAGVH